MMDIIGTKIKQKKISSLEKEVKKLAFNDSAEMIGKIVIEIAEKKKQKG